MGMKKQSSLKTAFWHFLFKLFGGLLGTVAVPFLLMNISTALGVTTYGDYSEIRSNELASVLAATPDLSEVEIPMGIEYVLLDKSYQIIETKRRKILDMAMDNRILQLEQQVAKLKRENETLRKENEAMRKALNKRDLNLIKNF